MGIRQEHRSNLMMKGQVDAANNSTYLSPEAEADRIACMAIPGRRALRRARVAHSAWPDHAVTMVVVVGWLRRQPFVVCINAATARLSITLGEFHQMAERVEIDLLKK